MNADPVNAIYTSQQKTKKGLYEELEGYFISSQSINKYQQAVTRNRHPCQNIPQTRGGSKYTCPFWIQSTKRFQSQSRMSFSINER